MRSFGAPSHGIKERGKTRSDHTATTQTKNHCGTSIVYADVPILCLRTFCIRSWCVRQTKTKNQEGEPCTSRRITLCTLAFVASWREPDLPSPKKKFVSEGKGKRRADKREREKSPLFDLRGVDCCFSWFSCCLFVCFSSIPNEEHTLSNPKTRKKEEKKVTRTNEKHVETSSQHDVHHDNPRCNRWTSSHQLEFVPVYNSFTRRQPSQTDAFALFCFFAVERRGTFS